ncbi:YheC/YheD family protein [Neobacillus sp. K501]
MLEGVFQFSCNSFGTGGLTFHSDVEKRLGFEGDTMKRIRFGSLSCETNISLDNTVCSNEASLSADIADKLNIPLHCELEVKSVGDEFLIGPFIGLLIDYDSNSINQLLEHLFDYLIHYRSIKGAIVAFTLDKVDPINHQIKGFLFNPKTKKWDEGTFPYPSSLFVLAKSISKQWIEHFQRVIGDKVFNDFNRNRWEILKTWKACLDVKNYLPESILYEAPVDLYNFIKRYPNVTVFPINSEYHSPLKVVLKDKNSITISTIKDVQNFKYNNRDQAYSIFKRFFQEGKAIIQESIDVTGYRTIHFRVILVKNQIGQWQHMGMFSRTKKSGTTSRDIFPLVKFSKEQLKELLKLTDLRISLIFHEIIHIATDAVKALEHDNSHLANAAVDMTIGEIGDIWVTDIQHSNPSHEIALVAGYPELYYEILKMNMLYAKKLAGF